VQFALRQGGAAPAGLECRFRPRSGGFRLGPRRASRERPGDRDL